jgi:hypothetical protein
MEEEYNIRVDHEIETTTPGKWVFGVCLDAGLYQQK